MAQPTAPQADSLQRPGIIGVVISGAAARGPYEAGVLAELLPRLFPDEDLSRAVLLGTSSGAVNAALWSHFADGKTPLATVGQKVCDFWLKFDQPHVFDFGWLLPRLGKVTSLLDTRPLRDNALRELDLRDDTSALSTGNVARLGVVATTCADDGSGGRSRIFYTGPIVPSTSANGGGIDYVPTAVALQHVLASAAIPGAFPAIEITTPASQRGYYVDGGVRLNTPIQAALELGAQRIVVVSSHATKYPTTPKVASERPDVIDLTAQALHAVLADGMIEDLRTLKRLNKLVRQNPGGTLISPTTGAPYKLIELLEASPLPGTLAKLAQTTLRKRNLFELREMSIRLKYEAFRLLLAGVGRGLGNDELLSYVFFDKEYATEQIKLGRTEGISVAQGGWKS